MLRCFFFLLLLAGPTLAAPSFTPDESFGIDGKVIHTPGFDSHTQKVIAQPDGKIVVFAVVRTTPGVIHIVRFNPDGTIDTGFGAGGDVTTPLNCNVFEPWHGGELLPDGKFLVAGAMGLVNSQDIAIARYNSDGTLDVEFGTGGITMLDLGGSDAANDIAIQPDGKIVVAGKSNVLHNEYDLAAARFTSEGQADLKFSNDGFVVFNRNSADVGSSAVIQPDSKILIGGRVGPFCGILRLNTDGTADTTFGSNGLSVHNSTSVGMDLALQSDGKILSVGEGLVRFNNDGSLDASFGNGGRVSVFATFLSAAVSRPDGSIVAAGNSSTILPGTDENFSTVLLDRNGVAVTRIDTDFNGHERAEALLLLPNGRVITAGLAALPGSFAGIGLAKYKGLSKLFADPIDVEVNKEVGRL